ncbi:MAG: sodium ion-translocating decarboxylase subunit beta [Clostridium sp.]|nr:sodium ion-translocating decarboxylase subunit beta [Clostridium sp.]
MDVDSISIIGGADGPTAIFLAGKLGEELKTGVIIFVITMLALAAVLVFWKPGRKTKYRFIRLSMGNLLIHLMDGLITFVNTPDLEMEGNILVSKFGYGWGALFTANLIGFIVVTLAAWCFNRYEHVKIPSTSMFDYYMKLFYGENYKPGWFWYKFSKKLRPQLAMLSYAIYWGVTAGAPVFVVGWLLRMMDITPRWWRTKWIVGVIYLAVVVFCLFKWVREGYKLSCGDSSVELRA